MKEDLNAVFGRWGPRRPRLARWGGRAALPLMDAMLSRHGIHRPASKLGRSLLAALERTIRAGKAAYVLGLNTASHNAGAALVRVSERGSVELICNEEEERYTAVKHSDQYPEHSIEAVKRHMQTLGLGPGDLSACVSSWDYASVFNVACVHPMLEEAPASLAVLLRERAAVEKVREKAGPKTENGAARESAPALVHAPTRLGQQLGLGGRMPIVGVRHHDGHAHLSYAVSPFAASPDPVMAIVIDGAGDDCTTSLYSCRSGRVTLLSAPGKSRYDSLGSMYLFLSVAEGGWPPMSSEGRYMGAAAWGDGNRLTNRYYRRLKHLFHFGPEGEVHINRALASWTKASLAEPYSEELIDILGEPILPDEIWNPDAILNVEDVRHPEITRDRVDKAAAVQMVFEDALVHIVDHAIRVTGSHRLVLTGGTALNCVANMRLLECFDEGWYERNLARKHTRLHLWVPPIPGDAGTPIGAAYAFAMHAGARPGPPLRHAFYCGHPPTTAAIRAAVSAEPTAASMPLGDCSNPEAMARVADLLAHAVANDRIMGIYQGVAETGPRALGHRSILANPCNPDTRRLLNERVKHRELIRPLAPMLTRAAAERFFYLEDGAADEDYNAYNYMVLTAHARPEAHETIPAVIHHDGTGRLQIVRPDIDPFSHEFLLAMGRRAEVEASVNTSLNVGAPIAHTPEQAVVTLKRARGMDGLLMIGSDWQATLVWLEDRAVARERLMESVHTWAHETGFALPDRSYLPQT
ncbi:MAG: carbamoyltransferase C-terminal domain-containing protein [Solirubrobacteraceae bacterium]